MDLLEVILGAIGAFLAENWASAFAALTGTFFGAYFAFPFERREKTKKDREANLMQGKRAQFALMAQLTLLKNMKKNYLDPRKDDPDRAFTLMPLSAAARPSSLDFGGLAFMLDDDGAQVLNEMMVSEQIYLAALGCLEQRNQRHESVQLRVAQLGPERALDQATVKILKDLTDSLYGMVDHGIETHTKMFEKLGAYLEKRFPKRKALGIEYLY